MIKERKTKKLENVKENKVNRYLLSFKKNKCQNKQLKLLKIKIPTVKVVLKATIQTTTATIEVKTILVILTLMIKNKKIMPN